MTDNPSNNGVTWAIIELFGHQRIAGRYSEHGAMHRVDVPDTTPDAPPEQFRFTRLYGPNAIYSITFVDEATGRLAAKHLETEPITIWELQREIKRLAAPAPQNAVIENGNEGGLDESLMSDDDDIYGDDRLDGDDDDDDDDDDDGIPF